MGWCEEGGEGWQIEGQKTEEREKEEQKGMALGKKKDNWMASRRKKEKEMKWYQEEGKEMRNSLITNRKVTMGGSRRKF